MSRKKAISRGFYGARRKKKTGIVVDAFEKNIPQPIMQLVAMMSMAIQYLFEEKGSEFNTDMFEKDVFRRIEGRVIGKNIEIIEAQKTIAVVFNRYSQESQMTISSNDGQYVTVKDLGQGGVSDSLSWPGLDCISLPGQPNTIERVLKARSEARHVDPDVRKS